MYITGNRHFCKLKLFETFVSKVVRFEIAIMRNVNNRKITVFTKMAFHTIFLCILTAAILQNTMRNLPIDKHNYKYRYERLPRL